MHLFVSSCFVFLIQNRSKTFGAKITGRKPGAVIHSPMFNLERYFPSLYGLNQSNIRVCQDSLEYAYVTPFPNSESPWAPEEFCSRQAF